MSLQISRSLSLEPSRSQIDSWIDGREETTWEHRSIIVFTLDDLEKKSFLPFWQETTMDPAEVFNNIITQSCGPSVLWWSVLWNEEMIGMFSRNINNWTCSGVSRAAHRRMVWIVTLSLTNRGSLPMFWCLLDFSEDFKTRQFKEDKSKVYRPLQSGRNPQPSSVNGSHY